MNNYEINTKEMKYGTITLLDILGWKGIWQRKADAVQLLLSLIDKATQRVENITGKYKRYKELSVEVKSISDTIALITYGECDISLEFQAGISGIIIKESILSGIPVRGATCYGHMTTQGNIMVGPAIDEVASWYEVADWIGVIQTPSAFLAGNHKYKYPEIFTEYELPIKQYGKTKTNCVNWLYQWKTDDLTKKDLKAAFISMGPITPSIANKFKNTLDFYEYSYNFHNFDFDNN